MSNHSQYKKIAGEMDRFQDIFHSLMDDNDEMDDVDIDFDYFFTNFNKNDEEPEPTDVPWLQPVEEEEEAQTSHELQQQQQQETEPVVLPTIAATPRKRPPTTPTTPTTPFVTAAPVTPNTLTASFVTAAATTPISTGTTKKKFRTEESSDTNVATNVKKLPEYLSPTNKTFEALIEPLLPQETTINKLVLVEELRHIAFLEHQMQRINLDRSLWRKYLQSGTGELKETDNRSVLKQLGERAPSAPRIWSNKLKSYILADPNVSNQEKLNLKHDFYLNYVNKKLVSFADQILSFQQQIEQTRQRLTGNMTLQIEETIAKLVQEEGLILDSIIIDGSIAAIEYNYKERLIELEFESEACTRERIPVFQKAMKSKKDHETAEIEVKFLKHRVANQQISTLILDSFQLPIPPILDHVENDSIRQRLIYGYEQLLQRTNSEMMTIHIRTAQAKAKEAAQQYDKAVDLCFKPPPNANYNTFTTSLTSIMTKRRNLIIERLQTLLNLKVRFLRASQQEFVARPGNNLSYGLSPTMIQYAAHHFNFEQIQLLNRGPTYVLPSLIHIFRSDRTLIEVLTQQYAPVRKQLLQVFARFPVDLRRRQQFLQNIEREFLKAFTLAIPDSIQQRTIYEHELIRSIHNQLKTDHLILRRTADEFNTFFLCDEQHFNQMTQDYMETSTCFQRYATFSTTHEVNSEQRHLTRLVESMDRILQGFQQEKSLPTDYFKKLQLKSKAKLSLPYLYFLPMVHPNGEAKVQPRLSSCKNAPIRTMAAFLDRVLRPLYENASRAYTLMDGFDFILKIKQHCRQTDRFTADTEFITFELYNIYMRVSHEALLAALNAFLNQQLVGNRHQMLSIAAIEKLTRFTLEHHFFTYQGRIYRYIKGCPLNYSFTELLFNIYLYQWERILIRSIQTDNEFYGRYHNRAIFTWKKSNNNLHECIKQLNEENPDIQLVLSSGSQVNFLRAYIENRNGEIYTRVHQNSTTQPFLLPYSTDHPRIFHRQYLRFRLVRAAQYCSSYDDFQDECLQIELTFLANGYSIDFVQYHFEQFFKRFNPFHEKFENTRMNYNSLRRQVFRRSMETLTMIDRQQQQQQQKQELLPTLPCSVSFYYLYDWGNRIQFNQQFREQWRQIILQDPQFSNRDFKVSIRSKHCYSSHTLLVKHR